MLRLFCGGLHFCGGLGWLVGCLAGWLSSRCCLLRVLSVVIAFCSSCSCYYSCCCCCCWCCCCCCCCCSSSSSFCCCCCCCCCCCFALFCSFLFPFLNALLLTQLCHLFLPEAVIYMTDFNIRLNQILWPASVMSGGCLYQRLVPKSLRSNAATSINNVTTFTLQKHLAKWTMCLRWLHQGLSTPSPQSTWSSEQPPPAPLWTLPVWICLPPKALLWRMRA